MALLIMRDRIESSDDLSAACSTYALWLRDSTEVTSKKLVNYIKCFFFSPCVEIQNYYVLCILTGTINRIMYSSLSALLPGYE